MRDSSSRDTNSAESAWLKLNDRARDGFYVLQQILGCDLGRRQEPADHQLRWSELLEFLLKRQHFGSWRKPRFSVEPL